MLHKLNAKVWQHEGSSEVRSDCCDKDSPTYMICDTSQQAYLLQDWLNMCMIIQDAVE